MAMFYKLASEEEFSLDDAESINSLQNRETDIAQDTPDTDTNCSDSSLFEFEVDSDEPSAPFPQLSTTASDDDLITAGTIAAVLCDSSSISAWVTEGEDSEESCVAPQTFKADYWTCVKCKQTNNNPMFRYCQDCFQERKQALPSRPHKRRRSKNLPFTQSSGFSVDSGISLFNGEELQNPSKKIKLEDAEEGPLAATSQLCTCCNVAKKDGLFLHGKSGHIIFCYKCSIRTLKSNKRCPICNRQVSQIIKVFLV